MAELFQENKIHFRDEFDLEEFIEEANIEIHEVAGSLIVFIIGKQPLPFGQGVKAVPLAEDDPLARIKSKEEVFGFTINLREGLFNIIDFLEVAIAESEEEDLSIGEINSAAIRLTTIINDTLTISLSHLEIGHPSSENPHERRSSLGFIVESENGGLVGWVEGLYLSKHPEFPNADFALVAGGMLRVTPKVNLVLEYSYLDDFLHQIALGPKINLTDRLTLGLQLSYNKLMEGDNSDEVVFGANVNYYFNVLKEGGKE